MEQPRQARPKHAFSLSGLCMLVVLLESSTSRGTEADPAQAKWTTDYQRSQFAQESRVSKGFDKDAIMKMLLPEPLKVSEEQAELPSRLFVKPWSAAPGLAVAVLQTKTHHKGDFTPPSTFYVAVFAGGISGTPIATKARAVFPGPYGRELKSIDLAPYRLANKTLAFAVRTSTTGAEPGGGGENEYLWLLVVDGTSLKRVWSTLMRSWKMYNESMGDDGLAVKAEEGDADVAIISVLKRTTRGFFDLRKSQGKRATIFQWNGTAYMGQGPDPVDNVNDYDEGDKGGSP
jgi:hypothetical protein